MYFISYLIRLNRFDSVHCVVLRSIVLALQGGKRWGGRGHIPVDDIYTIIRNEITVIALLHRSLVRKTRGVDSSSFSHAVVRDKLSSLNLSSDT